MPEAWFLVRIGSRDGSEGDLVEIWSRDGQLALMTMALRLQERRRMEADDSRYDARGQENGQRPVPSSEEDLIASRTKSDGGLR